jgi:GAF domain-containing protein
VLINDATQHPLVAHNLAVGELDVAAYAGMPLITSSGEAVGSLCAIDAKPREWSDDEVAALTDLGAILMELLELRSTGSARGRGDSLPGVA